MAILGKETIDDVKPNEENENQNDPCKLSYFKTRFIFIYLLFSSSSVESESRRGYKTRHGHSTQRGK